MKKLLLLTTTLFISSFVFCQFGPEQELTDGTSRANDVKTVDIDGDGDMDVLSASAGDDKIAWYENDGFGNFGPQQVISTNADEAQSVNFNDLDGDGDMDVLSASRADDKIAWYENDGNGNFGIQNIISTNADYAQFVCSSDLDGDGDIDVLSASFYDDKIAWYENDGNGNFSTEQIISSNADEAQSVNFNDLDGDGDIDVLSASQGDNKVAWYENDGNGNFGEQNILSTDAIGAWSVTSTDIDDDGDIDVLIAAYGSDKVAWYENNGSGDFGSENIISSNLDGVWFIHNTDLDGDGDMDVLAATHNDDNISWFENDGVGNFGVQNVISNELVVPKSVWSSDLDGDGEVDVLSASYNDSKLAWYQNDGNGMFGDQNEISTNAYGAQLIKIVDLDGDNDLDIMGVCSSKILWYENDGLGHFGIQNLIVEYLHPIASICIVDVNGDSHTDLIVLVNDQILWYENNGTASFPTSTIVSSEIEFQYSSAWPGSIAYSDIDTDGDIDVISATDEDNLIAWYPNDGTGNFGNQVIISTEIFEPNLISCGDVDNDGDEDVIVASTSSNLISWYENDGNGNFGNQQSIVISNNYPKSIYTADLNGDGNLDVLCTFIGDKVTWYENDGNGGFGDEILISSDLDYGIFVLSSDIDGDGDQDVFSASATDDKIAWYENDGYGNFGMQNVISLDTNFPSSLETADLDGDGDLELLSASLLDDKFAWYENLIEGCTDSLACNYNPYPGTDDGSCCYGICGCTDIEAVNYNPFAECDNGSCEYRLDGKVFFDENENGIMDDAEYGLPIQEVILEPEGLMGITNDEGNFYFTAPGDGTYTITINPTETFPFVTTPNPITFEVEFGGANQELIFGVSNQVPDFAVFMDFYPSGNGYPCNDFVNHNICYRNMGNVPIDGIVEVEYDTLFQGYQEATPIDSVVGNHIYMSFENLIPGQMFFYDVLLHTPTVDYMGEWLTSTARVYGYYEDVQVAYGESILVQELTCSYDPNDKQVFPAGYEEPHYVLNDTELEYLVRFQNTGNAEAINVIVSDTIDENLDLSTFMLMANSHSVMTSIDTEERVIDFFFENIMLPDSTTDEQGSHGLISYLIRPYPELEIETEINNTGYIYFDNNPAIITNTTWTTIYGCSNDLATIEAESTVVCQGEELSFSNTQAYVETYDWTIGGETIGTDSIITHNFENLESPTIHLTASNPLCETTDSTIVNIIVSNFANAGEDVDICKQESTTLIASGGDTFDWNGMGDESTLEVTPPETTTFQVTVWNEFDCEATDSVTVFVHDFPTAYAGEDIAICQGESTTLTATEGENYNWNGLGNEAELEVSPDETTEYTVIVTNGINCSDMDSVIVTVNPLPEANFTADGISLTAAASESYQWYLNGEEIEEATDQTYTISEDGNYSVEVTNEFGCSNLSEEIFITYIGVNEHQNQTITLSPNPMSNYSELFFGETAKEYQVIIISANGQLVREYEKVNDSKLIIQRGELASGVYIIRVLETESGQSFEKSLIVE